MAESGASQVPPLPGNGPPAAVPTPAVATPVPGPTLASGASPTSGAAPGTAGPPPLGPTPGQTPASRSGTMPDPLLGQTIASRFKILSVLARGGMGKVYRAEQSPLGRVCAVKVLNPNYQGDNDPEFSKRFFLEASIASRLKHPNTVTVYDYGQTEDGVYFMAMELLEGRTLHRLLREEAPLDPMRALRILLQVGRSLREAHQHGVIHRDLKPANIFLVASDEETDFVKVLDFGLVKSLDENAGESLTQTGLFMGSPKYMAPEQIRGERVSAATDVYALGVILFEMLTGKVPFDRPNSVNTLMAHVSEPVPSLVSMAPEAQVPQAIEAFMYRCLSKRPEERFASMDEFLQGLKRASGMPSGAFSGGLTGEHASGGAFVSGENALVSGGAAAVHVTPGTLTSQEVLAATATATGAPAPTAGRPWWIFASALVLVLTLVAVGRGLLAPRTVTPTAAPRTITVPPMPPAPSAVYVDLALDSAPPGATVLEDGRVLGTTPLRTRESHPEGFDLAHPRAFTLRLEGFEDGQVTARGGAITQVVTLLPRAQGGPGTPLSQTPRDVRPRRPRGPGSGPAVTPPPGYHRDPYDER
ncbi:MAG: serine/threonine protein kinase [Deltaproteobacteria bacterium]|nr:serine/threonine protein kinase [Deltaproteobacteria bacterium]